MNPRMRPSVLLLLGVFVWATAQDGTLITNRKPAVHRIGRDPFDSYNACFDAHPECGFSFFNRRQCELDADGNLFGRTNGRIYKSAAAAHISCNPFGPLLDSTLVFPYERGGCHYCVSKYLSLLHYDAPTRSASHVAALKDIRHSAQLPATRCTLRVPVPPSKRTKVIGTRGPALTRISDDYLQTFQAYPMMENSYSQRGRILTLSPGP